MEKKVSSIAIKTEFNHSYLVVDNNTDFSELYLVKMLLNNKMKNLLNCKEIFLEDKSQLYFDITNKKSILKEFETKTMSFDEIYDLFQQLSQTFIYVSSYLLKQDYFLLDPQYMFYDLETKELSLLYLPFKLLDETNMCMDIQTVRKYYRLADFILEKTNHKDEHAVNIAYQFYKMSKEDFFCISSFIDYIEKERIMKEASNIKPCVIEEKELNDDIVQENTIPQKKLVNYKIWILPVCMGLCSILSIVAYIIVKDIFLYSNYLFYISIILGLFTLIKCFYNITVLYRVHMDKQMELSMKESLEKSSVDDYWSNNEETVFFDDYQQEMLSQYTLHWQENNQKKNFILSQFPILIGKMEGEVDCLFSDSSISRIHAKIIKKDNVIKLQDMNSTNGTFLNGVRIYPGEEIAIQRNDEIQFGKLIVSIV